VTSVFAAAAFRSGVWMSAGTFAPYPWSRWFEPITCLAHGIDVRGGVPGDIAHDLAGPVNESIDSFAVAGRPIPDAA